MNPQVMVSLLLLAVGLVVASLPATAAVDAVDNNGHCELACTADWDPVCGSDGKTYPNECARRAAACKNPALTTLFPGECPDPCAKACTKEHKPVCSYDGVMYTQHANQCELNIAKCRASSSGDSAFEQKACPTNTPICGRMYYCGDTQKCAQDAAQQDTYYCANAELGITANTT